MTPKPDVLEATVSRAGRVAALTLGLAVTWSATGCESTADTLCRWWGWDESRYCCERDRGAWDAATSTCTPHDG